MRLRMTKQENGYYEFELPNGNIFSIQAVTRDSFSLTNLTPDCEGFDVETIEDSEEHKVFDGSVIISPEG
jgi:hypothetical protein